MDTTDANNAAPQPPQCPQCGQPLSNTDITGGIGQCPVCGHQFFLSVDEENSRAANGADENAADRKEEDAELSENRIQQVAMLRRGAIRSRSWFIIGAACCAGGAAQLVYMAVLALRKGSKIPGTIEIVMALALLLLALIYFLPRIWAFTRELRESRLHDPAVPPDFSSLRDGSQHWQNLQEMSDESQIE